MTAIEGIDIFSYTNYRIFLGDYIQRHYLANGKSYRLLSKDCGINSPNYFQQVVSGQKNMSPQMAEKVGHALGFKKNVLKFFIQLVRLDTTRDADKKFATLSELRKIASRQKKKTVNDESFHSNWLHQVIWNLAHTKTFDMNPHAIKQAVRGSATIDDIQKSLQFLKTKGYLRFDQRRSRYVAEDLKIESSNDVRNLDLQRNHNRFLQNAQMRLNDDVARREFQGFTMALTASQLPILKQQMRTFLAQLAETLDEPGEGDFVVRLQMAAFVVADPQVQH